MKIQFILAILMGGVTFAEEQVFNAAAERNLEYLASLNGGKPWVWEIAQKWPIIVKSKILKVSSEPGLELKGVAGKQVNLKWYVNEVEIREVVCADAKLLADVRFASLLKKGENFSVSVLIPAIQGSVPQIQMKPGEEMVLMLEQNGIYPGSILIQSVIDNAKLNSIVDILKSQEKVNQEWRNASILNISALLRR